jgi:hypothetical protein
MRRFTALIAAALALAAPAPGLAKGGYVRLPEPKIVRAGPPIPESELSPGQILGGCGAKRYRDPQTHKCRGPADFGN